MSDMAESPFVFAPPEWLDETPSTNDVLKERVARGEGARPGVVVAARRQTRGRGRMGNVWVSSGEGDLTFSFVWSGDVAAEDAGTLPVACCLGVRDFLALPRFGVRGQCKWPNDVVVDGEKICGILTEGVADEKGKPCFVVGIGVNLREVPERDAALGRRTASLERLAGRIETPEAALPPLLACLAVRIAEWRRGGFAGIRADVEAGLWGIGRRVTARTPAGPVAGVMAGLGDKGELLLRTAEGRIISVSSVAALS